MLRSIIVVTLLGSTAFAQQPDECHASGRVVCKTTPPKVVPKQKQKVPEYEMGTIDLKAKNRQVMLMTFLERASEELERATLEKRSFVPELVKTVDAESL